MISAHVLSHRPLVAAVAGVLLISACSSGAESTDTPATSSVDVVAEAPLDSGLPPTVSTDDATVASTEPAPSPATTTPSPSTTVAPAAADQPVRTELPVSTTAPSTSPPATIPPTTVPPADRAPIAVVDVAGRTVFGVSVFGEVDVAAVVDDASARLGSPTTDSGWQPTVGQSCAGSTDHRVVWWGDFRMTFERYQGDGAVRDELSAWTVGDPTLFEFAPSGVVPEPSASKVVTLEGIGLGATRADVESVWANVNSGGDDRLVIVDRGGLLTIRIGGDDRVVGFGDGPFDCQVDEVR